MGYLEAPINAVAYWVYPRQQWATGTDCVTMILVPATAKTTAPIASPPPSSEAARARMLACRPRDSGPEAALRSALHRMGLRFRVDSQPLPGLRRRADIVFGPARVAVFVDGCFWHGCTRHGTWPKANGEFWRRKIEANRERDKDTGRRLREAGWLEIRVWEHGSVARAAERIYRIVMTRRRLSHRGPEQSVHPRHSK